MFITLTAYWAMVMLIFWCYCGYLIMLFLITTRDSWKRGPSAETAAMPRIAVIVPCYNEEAYVDRKVGNLLGLEYDRDRLDVFFLHGLSTDGTGARIAAYIAPHPRFHLLETGCVGKIPQLNYGLARVREGADVVVSTDMDAMLEPDALLEIAKEFAADRRVAVVGANIVPGQCLSMERDYWLDQNLIRIMESKAYASSIVVAPCYAYKASLIERFPDDCVADDIFIAFKANTERCFVRYCTSAHGVELRAPTSIREFIRHKFRKGNAYLIELFRFFYRLPHMPALFKVIYGTKVLQLALLPWILLYFAIATISMLMDGAGLFHMALHGCCLLFVSLLITSFIMKRAHMSFLGERSRSVLPNLKLFIISNLILMLVGLKYPFYKQNSSYSRIEGG